MGSIPVDSAAALASLRSLCDSVKHDDNARKQLKAELELARRSVETPDEALWTLLFQSVPTAGLKVLVDMGAIDKLNASKEALSAAQIAQQCGADEILTHRLMRPLVPLGVLEELPGPKYRSTPLSRLLSDEGYKSGYIFMYSLAMRMMADMPDFFQETKFRMPAGKTKPTAFQYALQTHQTFYQYLNSNAALLHHFDKFMARSRPERPDWFTFYPVRERLFAAATRDDEQVEGGVVLIDIGGGEGHDVEALRAAFPDVFASRGKLILQDLPAVVANIKTPASETTVERQPHDFFTPQPVHGARAYYFRNVFHNYDDEEALQILANVKLAMTPGHSLLLLNDICLPDENLASYPALSDVMMMAFLNGMERTRAQWFSLLERAGFKINDIYQDVTGEGQSLIEAVPL